MNYIENTRMPDKAVEAAVIAHAEHMETYTIPTLKPGFIDGYMHALKLLKRDAGFIAEKAGVVVPAAEPVGLTEAEREDLIAYFLEGGSSSVLISKVERILAARAPAREALPYDDRLTCCPECRSVFEAEDDTIYAPARDGLAEQVRALADECASSDCIHLNDMYGRLRALLAEDERLRAIKAEALREAADLLAAECSSVAAPCFCSSAPWLRDRADALLAEGGDR